MFEDEKIARVVVELVNSKEIEQLKKQLTTLLLGIDAVQMDTCVPEDWDRLNTYADQLKF